MIQLAEGLPSLPSTGLNLYHTTDSRLSNIPIILYHGPSTTANSTLSNSRIQIHVFGAAGFQSYPRLTISPGSPFYAAVNDLPPDWQGDEVCRALAFGLLKYFHDIPETVRSRLTSEHSKQSAAGRLSLFNGQHAAALASSMVKVENITEVTKDLRVALQAQGLSHIDVDLVLPPGAVAPPKVPPDGATPEEEELETGFAIYGSYASIVRSFGQTVFLPTSKIRRAPSKPTSLNRSTALLKDHVLSLRREMQELVDTEERYVSKLQDLVHRIAQDFRAKTHSHSFEQDPRRLFPKSLDKILLLNTEFLTALQEALQDTEKESSTTATIQQQFNALRDGPSGRPTDPTGAQTFAKLCLAWFPRFSEFYQDYIRASQDFPQLISDFARPQSAFCQGVQQVGEQRLRSVVIEPVQRLPRYNLFIDNIVKSLPISHPAVNQFMKAKDIITSICSLDSSDSNQSQQGKRLQSLVSHWPTSHTALGRLISAVDVAELSAPFNPLSEVCVSSNGVLLLFSEGLVVLKKMKGSRLSARGLLAELEKSNAGIAAGAASANRDDASRGCELNFQALCSLGSIRASEACDGRLLFLSGQETVRGPSEPSDPLPNPVAYMRAYLLQGNYEGKASRWTEDFTKARVEGRFPEAERETDKWCLRHATVDGGLSLHTAVFEESIDTLIPGRKEPAPVRVVVDHNKGTKGAPVGHYGIEIVANVIDAENLSISTCRLEVDGLNDKVFIDTVDATTFMPVFAKRLTDLLRIQYTINNPAWTTAFISYYCRILKALHIQLEEEVVKPQIAQPRPPSPVKMLSNFFSAGGSITNRSDAAKQPLYPVLAKVPIMAPPARSGSLRRPDSSSSRGIDSRPANPLLRLEETFNGYVAALQSCKGNIVGKTLRNRRTADELTINALYNVFIEDPSNSQPASEVGVDILFAAFERFLRIAWQEQMGPVITIQTLRLLQEKSTKLFPGDFADFLKLLLGDTAPQNRRAFISIVKLLADLLDGCGNDGDRGSLTAAFAELLVMEGDAHSIINLLDRLVEDLDRISEDIAGNASSGCVTPAYGSVSSASRSTWSTNNGSISSNTSSIRRRFGFDTLLRSNSKTDSEHKPSVWRTLSKSSRHAVTGDSTGSSVNKASISRSKSIDVGSYVEGLDNRPRPHERPTVLGAFDDRPSSSHAQSPSRLSTIGGSPPTEEGVVSKASRRKRRSSLSDLNNLLESTKLGSAGPSSPTRQLPSPTRYNPPRTPSPHKVNATRPLSSVAAFGVQKENVRYTAQSTDSMLRIERQQTSSRIGSPLRELAPAAKLNNANVESSTSTTKVIINEDPPKAVPAKTTLGDQKAPPQKLRLQSPQKLRERLQTEAKAIDAAEASLKAELSKIGEEMAKLSGPRTAPAAGVDLQRLSDQLKAMESRIPQVSQELSARNDSVKRELEDSLQAAEYKVKGLDQLYKEVSAENELLYEKFNKELGKIVKALKGKGKEDKEELLIKMKEAMEEAARWKKENAKLRKEILFLKAANRTEDL